MKSKIILSLFFMLTALSLSAVPAHPGKFRYVQPDGSVIMLARHGDEWGHWVTDSQGRTVVKGADGFYRPVSEVQAQSIRRQAAARRVEARRRQQYRAGAAGVALGKKHFLVVLVEFSDLEFKTSDANTAFGNLLNQKGYSVNGGKGSARDYYYENSSGKFEPIFDVYGPVKLEHDKAYYGSNDSAGNDKCPELAVAEACETLDGKIDFSRYDNDGDGDVDLVFMYYAGYGEADSDDDDAIWPHQWELSSGGIDLTLDGKKLDSYACSSELNGTGTYADQMCGIGTACHEFAHAMGLPDFYDTDYDTNEIAAGPFHFSLMSGGGYNGDGRVPPYLGIEERIMLGWLDESVLQEFSGPGDYALPPVQENRAYKTLTDQEGEYFIYECRSASGWDAELPAHGLIVYHVDKSSHKIRIEDYGTCSASDLWEYWRSTNSINENGNHPCYYIVPACEQDNLKYGYEYLEEYGVSYFDPYGRGLAGNIPFPGKKSIKNYTAMSWNGEASSVSLSKITYTGENVQFYVTMPLAYPLDYYSIKNPGNGIYRTGATFDLELNEVFGKSYTSVVWRLDGATVQGPSLTLTAGTHSIEAVVNLPEGKRQVVTLDIEVK